MTTTPTETGSSDESSDRSSIEKYQVRMAFARARQSALDQGEIWVSHDSAAPTYPNLLNVTPGIAKPQVRASKKGRKSDAERQRECRARRKAEAAAKEEDRFHESLRIALKAKGHDR